MCNRRVTDVEPKWNGIGTELERMYNGMSPYLLQVPARLTPRKSRAPWPHCQTPACHRAFSSVWSAATKSRSGSPPSHFDFVALAAPTDRTSRRASA
jgi:hypothetical protein